MALTRFLPATSLRTGARRAPHAAGAGGGRNRAGRRTVRHRGGGHKQAYRRID